MTWREIWKSTVTNLRVLLGFTLPPRSTPPHLKSSRPTPPPHPLQAPIVKRNPMPLAGPLIHRDQLDSPNSAAQTPPPTIDLTPTRPLPSMSAPLRRKPSIAHVDV